MSETYTQGICDDGAAILMDGQPLTVEQVLARLNANDLMLKALERAFGEITKRPLARGSEHEHDLALRSCLRTAIAKAKTAQSPSP